MSDNLSVEAPGAQLQSVGEKKAVLFAALPGEETTFTIRIGTKKFETHGIIMMIIPATLEQMKDIKDLKEAKNTVEDSADAINESVNEIIGTIEKMSGGLKQVQSGLSSLDKARDTISSSKEDLYDNADKSLSDINDVAEQTAALFPSLENTINSTNKLTYEMKAVCSQSELCLDTAGDLVSLAETYFDILENGADSTDQALEDLDKAGDAAISLLESGTALIDNVKVLNDTMNQYENGTIDTLKDTEELMLRITNALNSSRLFLSTFEAMMKASSGNLDEGARNSLNGLIDVLEKGLMGISKTSVIRNASNTIKKAVDDEIDKYEKENHFLNLDAEAGLVSFTSPKNPPPDSIQIILRTEEISLDDNEDTIEDLEKAKEDVGLLRRILNIFVKIWQSIVSAFSG